MKKLMILMIIMLSSFMMSSAQSDFKIEKMDSVSKSQSQIYSDTKLFIAETWKSAQAVVQNDDKESGVILIKGNDIYLKSHALNTIRYVFSYTVTFLMKEGRYKIILDNVNYESGICQGYNYPPIDICDSCEYPGYTTVAITKNGWLELTSTIKSDMQIIVKSYENYIKQTSKLSKDW